MGDNTDLSFLQNATYAIGSLFAAAVLLYIVIAYIKKKSKTPTFANLSLLHLGIFLITISLTIVAFSNGYFLSMFYIIVFGVVTLMCAVTNVMPSYEYIQMTIGSLFIILLITLFQNVVSNNDTSFINNAFLLAGLFISWYTATYMTISTNNSVISKFDNKKIYRNMLL